MESSEGPAHGKAGGPDASPPRGSWPADLAVASVLFLLMTLLESPIQDGDGMGIAARAIGSGFLESATPKHVLLAPALRLVSLAAGATGHPGWSIPAFLKVMHLCGVGIYLVLSRGVYPSLLKDPGLCRACAAGTVLSYGVLSRSIALEHYAPALLLDLIAVAVLLPGRPGSWRAGAAGGAAFALAVGLHVTNLLIAPFLLALIGVRRGARTAVLAGFLAAAAIGGLSLFGMVHLGRTGRLWPLDPAAVVPRPDPEPSLGAAGRAARAAYGFARSIAFLPYVRHASRTFLAAYALAGGVAAWLLAALAWPRRASWGDRAGALGLLSIYVLPFTAIGLRYYPSDPERWLFLTPAVWLAIGWAVGDHARQTRRPRAAATALWGAVLALGAYNVFADLLPSRIDNPEYKLLRALAQVARPGDLTITGGGLGADFLRDYVLGMAVEGENVSIYDLAARHRSDHASLVADLRTRVRDHLEAGRRALVPGLFDESLHRGEGYPWAHIEQWGIGPETLLEALQPFRPEVLVPRDGRTPAIHSLRARGAG